MILAGPVVGVRRVVAQLSVHHQAPQGVHPEAVYAPVQPEAQHPDHRLPYLRVVPVEVGLLGEIGVMVVLVCLLVQGPRGSPEDREPVVWQAAVRGGVGPQVPLAPGARARGAGLSEPGMLARGVVRHEVEQDLEAQPVGPGDQPVEVRKGTEKRVHARVVRYVVAEVRHRGRVDRREPHRVHAEPGEVLQLARDAGQVADAVPVRVGERARIYVVDDPALPPGIRFGHLPPEDRRHAAVAGNV